LKKLAFSMLFLLLAVPLTAQPIATSITPSHGPVSGGTVVTLSGEFGEWPYAVIFGTDAVTATRVDAHTLRATTPAHLAGTVPIAIFEYDIVLATDLTFTFEGESSATYETLLLPVFVDPIPGAFGSEFRTDLTGRNNGDPGVDIYGLWSTDCDGGSDCSFPGDDKLNYLPVSLGSGQTIEEMHVSHPGTPGRLIYVPRTQLGNLSLNLRAYDTSRSSTNFGTEIPIPRSSDFRHDRFALTGVPIDPRFRLTLRIYSNVASEETVGVTVAGHHYDLELRPGASQFDPSYAEFTTFPPVDPPGPGIVPLVSVLIDPPSTPVITPPYPPAPVWAFISVTNNDTQHITTITPQP
jgi:hypothetical protein